MVELAPGRGSGPGRRMAMLVMAGFALALSASAGEQVFFSRSFPGSVPAYFDVTVSSDGAVVYREALDDEFPVEFQIDSGEVEKVFDLAEQLDRFDRDLASKLPTAFTGDKTFRFIAEDGTTTETTFVFTEDLVARELQKWFQHVGESERHFIELERVVQFDRLGVNKTLLRFQVSYDNGRIIGAEQFLPILQKISKQKKILHIARSRADGLIERITGLTE